MENTSFFDRIEKGLIVSCQAFHGYNVELSDPTCIAAMVRAVAAGGAAGIRTNLCYVQVVREASPTLPIIGLEKIACFDNDMRITPTMAEVLALVQAGADAVAIDGTQRPRLDGLSLAEFIREIKRAFDVVVLADISTLEEGLAAAEAGADGVVTTLSGYTPYSRKPGTLGSFPLAPPDYQLVAQLAGSCLVPVLAEGRIWRPAWAAKALGLGAHAVVVGAAITYPRMIAERFVRVMRGLEI